MDNPIKIFVLGDCGCGKTNIIQRIAGGDFYPNSPSTLSPESITSRMMIDKKLYNLQIWDSGGGQKRFRNSKKIFIKNSDIIILIYDITCVETFDDIYYWFQYIREISDYDPIICIFGNKIDLMQEKEINNKEMCDFAESRGIKLKFVSAKENHQLILDYLKELVLDYLKKINKISQKIYDYEIKKFTRNYIGLLGKYYNY